MGDFRKFCDTWYFVSASKLFVARYSRISPAMRERKERSRRGRGSFVTPAVVMMLLLKKPLPAEICAPGGRV